MTNKLSNLYANMFNRHSAQYPKDEVRVLRPTHQYSGLVSQIGQTHTSSERCVDNAVVITSVDDRTRQTAHEYFTSLVSETSKNQDKHTTNRNKGIATTVLGSLTATASIACLAVSPFAPLVIVSILVGSIATAALGIKQLHHHQKALSELHIDKDVLKNQNEQWNDPINLIVSQRKRAGIEGFQYVFNNNLKNNAIHPEEVKALWTRDFVKLMNNPINPVQIFNENILGKTRFQYTWDASPQPIQTVQGTIFPMQLNKMASLYHDCHQAFNRFEKEIDLEFNAIILRRSELIKEASLLKAQWLVPAERMYSLGSQEAESLYQSSYNALVQQRDNEIASIERAYYYNVRNTGDEEEVRYKAHLQSLCRNAIDATHQEFKRHPAVLSIQDAYEKDRRMNTLLYNQSKLVVDNFFDQRLRELDREVIQAKQQVEQQRSNGLQHFTNLLNRVLHPQNELALDSLSISSPLIMRNWKISNLDLNWHDVFGKLPHFHSSFASDITENAWNRFWGAQGLGRFASQPTHSWKTLFSDRSHFPFQNDWFRVKTYSQQFQRPTFCRPVVVPPPPFHREAQRPRPPVVPEHSFPHNDGNRVPVGRGQIDPRPHQPILPITPERSVRPSVDNHVRVGFGTTERRPHQPVPPVAPERPVRPSVDNHVRVGFGTTERRPHQPVPPVAPERTVEDDQSRVRVGYGRTERR